MDIPDPVSAIYGSRFCFKENSQSFYPYGNTTARDLLEYAKTEWKKDPSILILGFDDLRSVFYTIWRNFNPGFQHRFQGVHLMLNDPSPVTLARNLLLLYLCIKLPRDRVNRHKWLVAMWSIWYNHELLPDHDRVLRGALKALLSLADNWSGSDNPLLPFVELSSPDVLPAVKRFWLLWCTHKEVDSSKVLKNLRYREFSKMSGGVTAQATIGLFDLMGTMGSTLHQKIVETMRGEYKAYLEMGSVYVEELTEQSLPPLKKRPVNITMFEQFREYKIFYTQCPYRCFQQVHICSVDRMGSNGMYVSELDRKNFFIRAEIFRNHPLLANSFQLFCVWVAGSSDILLSRRHEIKLYFSLLDGFDLAQAGGRQFELVHASNIVDHVAPAAFILACMKLVKDHGLFLCGSILHKELSPTVEGYIKINFGFPSKFLPVICGVRCYNHEGDGYTSLISTEHFCVDPGDTDPKTSSMREKLLIWEKVDRTPFIIKSLFDCPDVYTALVECFFFCCTPLTRMPTGRNLSNLICTGTAMDILETFVSRLDSRIASSHSFWSQFCSDIKKGEEMNLFFVSIQTQAFLRGIHLHLIVDSSTCPVCTGEPFSDYLGEFSVEVPASKVSTLLPIITVFISEKHLSPSDFDNDMIFLFAFTKSMQEHSAHNVDCVTGAIKGEMLQIRFLAPLNLCKPGYSFTLNEFVVSQGLLGRFRNRTNVLQHGSITSCLAGRPHSMRPKLCSSQLEAQTFSLGTIVKHSGNGDFFETVLSLTEGKPELLTEKLTVRLVTPRKLETLCANHSFSILYPYPVAYGKLNLQRSKKTKTLTIKAYRRSYLYEEDTQLFYINPEDQFTLPNILPSTKTMELFVQKQYKTKEKIFKPSSIDITDPLLAVEQCIKVMLTLPNQLLFFLVSADDDDKVFAVFEILNRGVDVYRKVPILHLFLCFVENLPDEKVSLMASLMSAQCEQKKSNVMRLQCAKNSFRLLEVIFRNFSRYTVQTPNKRPRFIPDMVLPLHGNYCCQAVVYPLYQEPCRAAVDLRCAGCRSVLSSTKDMHKCSCKEVWYCSPECRGKHFKEHSKTCKSLSTKEKPSDETPKTSQEKSRVEETGKECCACCLKQSSSLKSCSKCRQTLYCGRDCQITHWKVTHKFDCASLRAKEQEKLKCGVCEKATSDLTKCTECEAISYCEQCKERHLSEHKPKSGVGNSTDAAASAPQEEDPAEEPPPHSDSPDPQPSGKVSSKTKKKKSSKPASKEKSGVKMGPCGYCGKKPSKPHRCARCHKVLYCGSECQKAHWKEHKSMCKSSN